MSDKESRILHVTIREAAAAFMLHAVQDWNDPKEKRVAAVQKVLDLAQFNAVATCYPVFGGIWKEPCKGPDGDLATDWLKKLTENLERGEYHSEVKQIEKAIRLQRGDASDA